MRKLKDTERNNSKTNNNNNNKIEITTTCGDEFVTMVSVNNCYCFIY